MWAWIFLLPNPVLTDSQLTLGRQEPSGQHGLGLYQCQKEREGVSQQLATEPNGVTGIPDQDLKRVHALRITVCPKDQEMRKSLQNKQERIIWVDNPLNRSLPLRCETPFPNFSLVRQKPQSSRNSRATALIYHDPKESTLPLDLTASTTRYSQGRKHMESKNGYFGRRRLAWHYARFLYSSKQRVGYISRYDYGYNLEGFPKRTYKKVTLLEFYRGERPALKKITKTHIIEHLLGSDSWYYASDCVSSRSAISRCRDPAPDGDQSLFQ